MFILDIRMMLREALALVATGDGLRRMRIEVDED
jgi:hypothetical protein